MRFQILGTKLGMTQMYDGDQIVPVTVIKCGPCVVTQVKTPEKDQYAAIQVGYGTQKPQRMTKPERTHVEKAGAGTLRHLTEFRLGDGEAKGFTVGQAIHIGDGLKVGDFVDVIGTSKGKGFQGVMKRHNFAGFMNSHGAHEYFRHGGSLGCRLTPGRVFKGMRMGGHMGAVRSTVQNLVVYRIDAEQNLIFVRGAVPGARGGLVTVALAKKKGGKKAKLNKA